MTSNERNERNERDDRNERDARDDGDTRDTRVLRDEPYDASTGSGGSRTTSDNRRLSKWNARYAYSGEPLPAPARVLTLGEQFLPEPATRDGDGSRLVALDLACGRAANGEWLAARGFETHAWDYSTSAIEAIVERRSSRIDFPAVRNVVAQPPEPKRFDVIVVIRFLDRTLCPAIEAALKPGGVLFYQTFTEGLSNPDFMLDTNELLVLFPSLDVVCYDESSRPDGKRREAMLVGQRPA